MAEEDPHPPFVLLSDRATAADHLDRPAFQATLAGVVRQIETPASIAVYGGWGTGKTSALLAARAALEQQGWPTVWFDPWAYEQRGDVLLALMHALSKSFRRDAALWSRTEKLLKGATKTILSLTARVGLMWMTGMCGGDAKAFATAATDLVRAHGRPVVLTRRPAAADHLGGRIGSPFVRVDLRPETLAAAWYPAGRDWREAEKVAAPAGWDRQVRGPSNRPVVGVSFWEASAYARWLGQVQPTPGEWPTRLPTEAEWERAVRGGADQRRFPWGDDYDTHAAACGTGGWPSRPVAVCTCPHGISPEGLLDAVGNVWCWTLDGYIAYYAGTEAVDPYERRGQTQRVLRGGSWAGGPGGVRLSYRSREPAGSRHESIGFRVVASPRRIL